MKKLVILILCLSFALSMASCKKDNNTSDESKKADEVTENESVINSEYPMTDEKLGIIEGLINSDDLVMDKLTETLAENEILYVTVTVYSEEDPDYKIYFDDDCLEKASEQGFLTVKVNDHDMVDRLTYNPIVPPVIPKETMEDLYNTMVDVGLGDYYVNKLLYLYAYIDPNDDGVTDAAREEMYQKYGDLLEKYGVFYVLDTEATTKEIRFISETLSKPLPEIADCAVKYYTELGIIPTPETPVNVSPIEYEGLFYLEDSYIRLMWGNKDYFFINDQYDEVYGFGVTETYDEGAQYSAPYFNNGVAITYSFDYADVVAYNICQVY